MNNLLLVSAIGLLGGLAIGLQAPLANIIGQRLGILESVLIIHLGGFLAAAILLFGYQCYQGYQGSSLAAWQGVPWYALAAGVLGVILISAQVYIIPVIGVAATITLVVAGQLIIASCIDHFGILEITARPLGWDRLPGLLLVLAGVWLTVRQ